MAKAVILKTDKGVLLIGGWQCSKTAYWTAENCYKYCNYEKNEFLQEYQVGKLMRAATIMGFEPRTEADWYKNRDNFIDIEVPYDNVVQEYRERFR